ncbi:uncharacterized protein LOC124253554 [Haliotis rubra]|uniref:uncharacterized protein LOC124253554 n=1 Tax=Haliotis rubra TaxID=36100 RepID=UPI001EE63204|nr:uncharacterized protein LOC124253554 [Haliotis rubra]
MPADVHAQNACIDSLDGPCLAKMRSLYTNTSAFWFGTRYATDCPPGKVSPLCRNTTPSLKSLLSRIMGEGATDSSGLGFVPNVTYHITLPTDGSDRKYNGCGRIVQVPLTRPQDFVIDPLANSIYPPYDLREEPEVTWPAEENALYTVMMFDPNPFYMHALYVNVPGGRLQNGDTILPYSGPGNPLDRNNPYVWLVFKQKRSLDPSQVPNSRRPVHVQDLVSQLALSTRSYGISVILTSTDEYTAAFIRSVNFLNRCPVYYGQWFSSYIQKKSGLPSLPERLDLSVSVDVTFTAPSITYKSCGMLYDRSPVNVTVDYRNMDLLRSVETRISPQVKFVPLDIGDKFPSDKQYTLMMLDLTPELGKTNQNSIIHWMVVNIPGADITSGDEVYDWQMPMASSLNHLYLFAFFEQEEHISNASARTYIGSNCPSFIESRCSFRAGDFIRDNNLTLLGLRHLRVMPDTYQQYMSYAVAKISTMEEACWGRTETAEKCPTA